MNHTQLLNYIISKHGLLEYLEIGVWNGVNFKAIKCTSKCGVDPDRNTPATHHCTSDYFFKQNKKRFDCVFDDGLHHADQVERDFNNSLACLNDNGFIILHDTCPDKEEYTIVPRANKIWYGDVYKFACRLGSIEGIDYRTISEDCGCTVIRKGSQETHHVSNISWHVYATQKNTLLNISTPEELKQWI